MSESFMILHKVRGEPALDIAERATIGDEVAWIVSTSGHRAYPIDHWPIDHAIAKCVQYAAEFQDWAALPDHYQQHIVRRLPRPPSRTVLNAAMSKLTAEELAEVLEAIKETADAKLAK